MTDTNTIRVYDMRAADYANLTDTHNADDPHLATFIERCAPHCQVLDLGCGPGTSAAVMAQAGLQVDAIDASAEMVALAARHPGVAARQASFDDVSGQAVYGGIWANFSLLHTPRTAFLNHLKALHTALKPNGAFFIGMKLGNGEARDGIGRLYTYYTSDELDRYLANAGFTVSDRWFGRGAGLDGTMSDWIALAAYA